MIKDHRVYKAFKELKVIWVSKVIKDLKETLVHKDLKV